MAMRFAFMGTPDFAAVSLRALIAADKTPVAVYARAPQPAGRGHKLRPSPVQAVADAANLPVYTPQTLKNASERDRFAALDLDYALIVAYGLILPQSILDIPSKGCFNLHGSLLPRWRGAAPIQRAIMAGDTETGVQVMRMEAGLDTGPVVITAKTSINADDTFATLHDRLASLGADLLVDFAHTVERGDISETPQAADGVLYATKISPAEARIDWAKPADVVDRHIRGLSPFPGAYFFRSDESAGDDPQRVKVLMSRVSDKAGSGAAPGTVLETDGALTIACASGAVDLVRLQRAGRSAQDANDFLRGFPLRVDEIV